MTIVRSLVYGPNSSFLQYDGSFLQRWICVTPSQDTISYKWVNHGKVEGSETRNGQEMFDLPNHE